MKSSWYFHVTAIAEVNIQRILDETKKDKNIVIITNNIGKIIIVFVREAFLAQFYPEDKIKFCGENLHLSWGVDYCLKLTLEENESFSVNSINRSSTPKGYTDLHGWRYKYTNLPVTTEKIVEEFKAAKKFNRQIVINALTF
jgi:hypothetical protein